MGKQSTQRRAVETAAATAPDLSLPLAYPITLTGGPRSHLVTLMDAAILIRDMEPFDRRGRSGIEPRK
jgi:hypothetical protein